MQPQNYLSCSSQNVLPTGLSNQVISHLNGETIHLFMSLNGKKLSKRLTNTLKTILYYQNRVRRKDPRCLISLPNATTLPCPRDSIVSRTRSIHLHFFADSQTRDYVNSSLTKWNLQGVTWTMYSFEQHRVGTLLLFSYYLTDFVRATAVLLVRYTEQILRRTLGQCVVKVLV